ncbi:MAG: putative lipid II flippase FtsW [Desulfomonilia bacterium]
MRGFSLENYEIDFDVIFFLVTLSLMVMGSVMIFSSSYFVSKELCGNGIALTQKHLIHVVLGICMMLLVMSIDYRRFRSRPLVLIALLGGISALVLCFVPGIGKTAGHACRWVKIASFSFQASEAIKIALILYMSYFLSKQSKDIRTFSSGILPVFIIVGISCLLIFLEPDFGTAATLGIWALIVLFLAGMRVKHLALTILPAIPLGIGLMLLEPYRRARLTAFINPWDDMLGVGYQIIQSMVAFANGGLLGSGLGEGTQKLFFLPAPHTDFILSVAGEELGFIGIVVIVTLFGLWIWRGFSIALATNDSFGFYLVITSVCLVGLQALINMGVSMSALPTTGIALPFFSYGGSTLLTTMVISGVILSVSRRARL